ncbi:hypothetical protein ABIB37_000970 [Agrococcus sp. UYP10]|uniref:hypothetical protein n=1 Tax=Agrococcus sp. UYP10 TaxID=1756355 RepID=UPI0033976D36
MHIFPQACEAAEHREARADRDPARATTKELTNHHPEVRPVIGRIDASSADRRSTSPESSQCSAMFHVKHLNRYRGVLTSRAERRPATSLLRARCASYRCDRICSLFYWGWHAIDRRRG